MRAEVGESESMCIQIEMLSRLLLFRTYVVRTVSSMCVTVSDRFETKLTYVTENMTLLCAVLFEKI